MMKVILVLCSVVSMSGQSFIDGKRMVTVERDNGFVTRDLIDWNKMSANTTESPIRTTLASPSNYTDKVKQVMSPCTAEFSESDRLIHCNDVNITGQDLFDRFTKLTEFLPQDYRTFREFSFRPNPGVHFQFHPGTFKLIQFKLISLEPMNLLNYQDDMFAGTEQELTELDIYYFALPKRYKLETKLIEIINRLNLHILVINGAQVDLVEGMFTAPIEFVIDFSSVEITKFEPKAFSKVKCIDSVRFQNSLLNVTLPDYAFEMPPCNERLEIQFLWAETFAQVPFSNKTFVNIQRPTTIAITLNNNHLKVIDEHVFRPFLEDNPNNSIELDFALSPNQLDCDDCRNKWIYIDNNVSNRIKHLTCLNGKQFNDTSNFKNC